MSIMSGIRDNKREKTRHKHAPIKILQGFVSINRIKLLYYKSSWIPKFAIFPLPFT